MNAQLKKGLLDACVLATLNRGDSYGYQLIREVSAVVEISESTLYPILRRLEKTDCLKTYSVACDGRLRKYYSISPVGRIELNKFLDEWKSLFAVYEYIKRS